MEHFLTSEKSLSTIEMFKCIMTIDFFLISFLLLSLLLLATKFHGINIFLRQVVKGDCSANNMERPPDPQLGKVAQNLQELTFEALPVFAAGKVAVHSDVVANIMAKKEKLTLGDTKEEHTHGSTADAVNLIGDTASTNLLPWLAALVAIVLQICQEAAITTTTTKYCGGHHSRRKGRSCRRKLRWSLPLMNALACVTLLQHGGAILRVDAVFTPVDLDALKAGWRSCKTENSGNGDCPTFANEDDGSDTGSRNGLIRSWNVSLVTSMDSCELFKLLISVFFFIDYTILFC